MTVDKPPALDVLRTFLAVYRTGTFTGAAKLLAVTQPTVTNHIGALERQLGRELFERTAVGVTPTAYAHEMAAAFGDQLDQIDRFFLDEIAEAGIVRTIHLGGPAEFTTSCLIPALAPYGDQLPRIEMEFGDFAELIAALTSGRLDLVVSTLRPRDEAVLARPIADEEFWLVCAPQLAPAILDLDSIRQLPVVTYHRSLPIVRRYWTTIFGELPDLRLRAVLPNLFALQAAVVHGLGMSVLPSYLVHDQVAAGNLVRLDTTDIAPLNTLYLAARTADLNRRSGLRNAAALIVEAVKKHQNAITPKSVGYGDNRGNRSGR
ncbi:LysR family transcriptional regulator [Nocardia iowensis]|uniref:LysR family transcriptional regulator n=1 Tax=Nocardia iowensis TaxID=204891 RepID=A0ABX8RY93_NOCIO|nr:LysR family transcriptional regulator [Nocardia iowensis]QXN94256.1 LysR family transcriptional regulator [Nocardia iowensis]